MGLTGFPPECRRDYRMKDIPHLDDRNFEALFIFYFQKKKRNF